MTKSSLARPIVIGAFLVLAGALILPRMMIEERRYVPAIAQAYTTASQVRDSLSASGVAIGVREDPVGEGTVLSGRLGAADSSDARFEVYVMNVRRLADSRHIPSFDRWSKSDPRATNFRGTAGNVAAAVLVPGSDPLTANYPHDEVAAFDRALLGAFEAGHRAVEPQYEFDD